LRFGGLPLCLPFAAVERDPYSGAEVVLLERWGKVSCLFGPISFKDPHLFLDKVRSSIVSIGCHLWSYGPEQIRAVLSNKWFHGNLSRDQVLSLSLSLFLCLFFDLFQYPYISFYSLLAVDSISGLCSTAGNEARQLLGAHEHQPAALGSDLSEHWPQSEPHPNRIRSGKRIPTSWKEPFLSFSGEPRRGIHPQWTSEGCDFKEVLFLGPYAYLSIYF
jgi:hypothetical protein